MNCLPQPGGLFDQDSLLVYGMSIVLDAQNKRQEREIAAASKKGKR